MNSLAQSIDIEEHEIPDEVDDDEDDDNDS